MKILFSADWHIKIGQRKVPEAWQRNRFHMMVDELNKVEADLHIIGGDIFDKADATLKEIELYFELMAKLAHKTKIYSGNHEAKTKSYGILHYLAEETTRCNPLVQVVLEPYRSKEFDIIDFFELHKDWEPRTSDILFTHVRAELPEHMKTEPEIDLAKFDDYAIVFAGDLHAHSMSQKTAGGTPIIYPGSPLTTSFHRELVEGENGYLIIDTELGDWTFHSLDTLPQLLRLKVDSEAAMKEDPYHRVIYELEGDLQTLGKVKDADLLDKKVNISVSKDATLELEGLTVEEELAIYLAEVEGLEPHTIKRIMKRFASAVKTS